jgi:hypothetical protein
VTRVRKAGEMKGMLMGGSGNDGVHVTAEGELDGGFNRMAGNSAGPDGPIAVGRVSGTETP